MMKVIHLRESGDPEHWLSQIERCDWRAGQFLGELIRDEELEEYVGEGARVLLLTDGEELVSFCTYAPLDDVQPTDLTPWMGWIYTFPERRGHRYAGRLFEEVEKIARAEGVTDVYISTNHTGLYEKYGCEFYAMMNDVDGEASRVYRRHIAP